MIKISVVILVYNHERYIRQALEGVLMQQTNFVYEVIIGDDSSTDQSQAIIREMIPKFEGRMVPILRKKNLGAMANLLDLLQRVCGEYVAFLEGDDYWIDPLKLQKQVEYLERHPEFVACYHKNQLVNGNGKLLQEKVDAYGDLEEFTLHEQNLFMLPGQTATTMVRSNVIKKYNFSDLKKYKLKYTPGDRILPILLLSEGRIYCSQEVMSAYRTVVESDTDSWTKKYGLKNAFGNMAVFRMHKEMERIGKGVGLEICLKDADVDSYVEACQELVFKKRVSYLPNLLYMFLFSTHRLYMITKGNKIFILDIKAKVSRKLKNAKVINKMKLK